MKGVKHFKSKAGYGKWLAYGHIHTKTGLTVKAKAGRVNVFDATPGSQKIFIHGRPHMVSHRR